MPHEPLITVGTLMHLVTLIGTIIVVFWKVATWLHRVEATIWTELHRLHTTNVEALGRIDARITVIESKVSDLWEARRVS